MAAVGGERSRRNSTEVQLPATRSFCSGNFWVFKTWQESGLWSTFSSHDCAFSDCSPSPRGGIRESEKLDSHCLECVRLSLLDSVQTLVLYFLWSGFLFFPFRFHCWKAQTLWPMLTKRTLIWSKTNKFVIDYISIQQVMNALGGVWIVYKITWKRCFINCPSIILNKR